MVAHKYLEGTHSKIYTHVTRDEARLVTLFQQFRFPGGIPSHVVSVTPEPIHEGGDLGYSLTDACGVVLDNPDLIAAGAVGDRKAKTGPLATY